MEETGKTRPLYLCEVCCSAATERMEGFSLCGECAHSVWIWVEKKQSGWSVYQAVDIAVWSMRDDWEQLHVRA